MIGGYTNIGRKQAPNTKQHTTNNKPNNYKSQILNPLSKIPNLKSKINNPKSFILLTQKAHRYRWAFCYL
jgi:hypothetical protein